MIHSEKANKLIEIYMFICDRFDMGLKNLCMRHSNNCNPLFSDEELLAVYLFCGACEQRVKVKDKHKFAKEYLLDWFPNLPSYQTFNKRLNMLAGVMVELAKDILISFKPSHIDDVNSLVDSMPIITCASRNRQAKVAREIADKGYCSTKNLFFYGVRLNLLAHRVKGTIPYPEMISITPASENDGTVFKRDFANALFNKNVFADKIYKDDEFYKDMELTHNLRLFTPCKAVKDEPLVIKQREQAFRDLYSRAVSAVRQPIESFFNWLNEKTSSQRAHYVRSTDGLVVHVMGCIAIAFTYLIFNC